MIDRLLASERYGERWGRHWLDVARYADDQLNSTEMEPYPSGFRFRDWVIEAFNKDMPYDLFVKAQLAGDLLDHPDREEIVGGLGFYALSPPTPGRPHRCDHTGLFGLDRCLRPVSRP